MLLVFAIGCVAQQTGTFTDPRDGKIYKTVEIGKQVWMAENLNFIIQQGCACYKDDTTNCDTYGRLYRWEAAKMACPPGWHLPSDEEWSLLIDILGGTKVAGGKMKASELWEEPANELTNSSGFNALPAGQALYTGVGIGGFMGIGNIAVWWTATKPELSSNPIYLYINTYKKNKIIKESGRPNLKFSVRCIHNK